MKFYKIIIISTLPSLFSSLFFIALTSLSRYFSSNTDLEQNVYQLSFFEILIYNVITILPVYLIVTVLLGSLLELLLKRVEIRSYKNKLLIYTLLGAVVINLIFPVLGLGFGIDIYITFLGVIAALLYLHFYLLFSRLFIAL